MEPLRLGVVCSVEPLVLSSGCRTVACIKADGQIIIADDITLDEAVKALRDLLLYIQPKSNIMQRPPSVELGDLRFRSNSPASLRTSQRDESLCVVDTIDPR